jgi:hypothetical protein
MAKVELQVHGKYVNKEAERAFEDEKRIGASRGQGRREIS